jgi:hypothetical protein
MEPIVRATFKHTDILIDGQQYIECTFINCTLNFGGTLKGLLLKDCEFTDCVWGFVGPAEDTIKYLALLYSGLGTGSEQPREIVEDIFKSIRHEGLNIVRARASGVQQVVGTASATVTPAPHE